MYQQYIDALSVCATLNEVCTIGNDICAQYGFDRFIYSVRLPFSLTSPEYLVLDSAMNQRRTGLRMQESIPYNIQQLDSTLPMVWRQKVSPDSQGVPKTMYPDKLSVVDVHRGLSIPVHAYHAGRALVAYTTAREDENVTADIDKALPELCLIASHKHEAINRFIDMAQYKPQLGKISKREQECIRWSAEGLTTAAIAVKLCISESTVTFHLQNAMRKLDAKNRQQVVARAIMMGAV